MKKRICALLLSLFLLIQLLPLTLRTASAETYSGTCGEDLTWTFDSETGELTIEGSGEMDDYSYEAYGNTRPWASYTISHPVKSIVIGEGVTGISKKAFYNYSKLTLVTLPDSLTDIGAGAFSGCGSLTEITIPSGVTNIGGGAFSSCILLTRFNVAEENRNYCEIEGVLFSKDQKKLIAYPIGDSRTSYEIPSGVTEICDSAFTSSKLTEITLPDSVTSIGHDAFSVCGKMTEIIIPDGVTSIGDHAFSHCGKLTEVIIPDSVTEIGNNAFYNCGELTEVVISDGAVSIGEKCFYSCENLTKVTLPCSVRIDDPYTFSYPAGTYYVTKIESVHLTKGTGAMVNNPGAPWKRTTRDIKSLILDEGITSICDNAFSGIQISTLTIPDSVSFIGKDAFDGRKLMELTLPCSARLSEQSGLFTNGGTVHITKGTGVMADYTASTALPWRSCSEITIDEGITYIGKYAFHDCVNFSETFIPDSVVTIGEYAYSGCTGLTSVNLPAGLKRISDNAFSGCTGLTSVEIPNGVTYLSGFSDCTGLRSVPIPDSVTEIGKAAFSNCTGLTSVTLPNSVTSIGNAAFENCTGLYSITIPDSVTTIGDSAFSGCTRFSSITIPDNVTTIGGNAFFNCNRLQSITIGNAVSRIGDSAFSGCTNLSNVTYHGTHQMRNRITIGGNNSCLINAAWHYLPVLSIAMRTLPNKLVYHAGEALSVAGGTITARYAYSIAETETITVDMVTGFRPETAGRQTLTVSFGAKTVTYEVTVNPHVPGEPVHENEVDPTCTEDGHYDSVVYCTVCHTELDREEVIVPAKGHVPGEPVRENEVEPTCMTNGHYDEVVYCTVCGAELSRESFSIDRLPFEGMIEWDADDVSFKGSTAYVIADGSVQMPRFTVKNKLDGSEIDPAFYDYEYRENTRAGTGYVFVTFTGDYTGTIRASFKIYLPATTKTTVANIQAGIKVTWDPVPGAAGYVIYRRAWSSTTNGWTAFARWDNTTDTQYIDGADANHKVYAGTRYQYGVKAYFARRTDPVTGAQIGGNVNNDSGNFNLGEVGPLKTTVRITTRTLKSVTGGLDQVTVNWEASSLFTGYQIQYAEDSSFSNVLETITVSNPKTTQRVIKNLWSDSFAGTTYYVRIRSYHVFNGVTYYGGWSPTRQGVASPKYRALVFGESNYHGYASNLPGCQNDAIAVEGMLKNVSEPFCVKGYLNAGRNALLNKIDELSAGTTASCVSVFYFSGHGVDADGDSTYQGALATIDGNCITFGELASALSKVKGRVIVILDSCHSGASIGKSAGGSDELEAYNNAIIEAFSGYDLETEDLPKGAKSGALKTSKFIVITAASTSQSSWDGRYDGSGYPQGAFTAALIKGMGFKYPLGAFNGSARADTNSDGRITLKELYTYTYNQAYEWTRGTGSPQRAQYYGPDNEVLFTR
jgi:hypothetical protein